MKILVYRGKMVLSEQKDTLPTKSGKFWGILISLFAVIMILTMLKDWWLTTEKPNVLFYIFVPLLSILSGVLSMYLIVKISKQTITFLTMLAISIGVNTLMQIVENVMKITYYRIWKYPGFLYIVVVILLGFLLMIYGLIRWGRIKNWMAVILAVVDFIGSMVVGAILTGVIGLTTPGS